MSKVFSRKTNYCIASFEDGTCEVQDTDMGLPVGIFDSVEEAKEHFPNAMEIYSPFKVSAYERIYADGRREIVR